MRVAIHQPAYLPWVGYFSKLMYSDIFVYFDDVQIRKRSPMVRNKIINKSGEIKYLTLPISLGNGQKSTCLQAVLASESEWRKNHLNAISETYAGSLSVKRLIDAGFSSLILSSENKFSDYLFNQLIFLKNYFNLPTTIVRSSEICVGKHTHGSERILAICEALGANYYVTGTSSLDYLELEDFSKRKIRVMINKIKYEPYPQNTKIKFIENLSFIDVLAADLDFMKYVQKVTALKRC